MSQRLYQSVYKICFAVLGVWLAFIGIAHLTAEILWFEEVNYLSPFLKRLSWQLSLWFFAGGISALFLIINLRVAHHFKWKSQPQLSARNKTGIKRFFDSERNNKQEIPQSPVIGLFLLLLMVMVLGLSIGLVLIYYGQEVFRLSQSDFTLFRVKPPILFPFEIESFSLEIFFSEASKHIWQAGTIAAVLILIVYNTKFWTEAIAYIMSAVFGLLIAANWTKVLLYLNPTAFGQKDPILKDEIGFYIFSLPWRQLLDFWLGGLFLYALLSVSIVYLLSANSLSEGKFPGFSRSQLRHIYALGGAVLLAISLHHWLRRYELLYSGVGVVYGAGYTDVQIHLPVETILALLSLLLAIWLLLKARVVPETEESRLRTKQKKRKKIPVLIFVLTIYLSARSIGFLIGEIVQLVEVQPNELNREAPYIENSINLTRAGFKLNEIEETNINPKGTLTALQLKNNNLTIDNIRLWDTRPLLQTNRQLQQIRLYYKFPDADIDRYNFKAEDNQNLSQRSREPLFSTEENKLGLDNDPLDPKSKKEQIFIAPRELDYSAVPDRAKTWVNEHLVYTHGYGFTLSPVNQVNEESGLPEYYVKDIGTPTDAGGLRTSSELIEESIPIGKPRIYYGELTNTYVMTNTNVLELDFPKGEENAYNTYDGTGGINIGSLWRRWVFVQYLKDWRMLFARNLTEDSRILFRRQIMRRVEAIAPFLYYDRDPYLVVSDAGDVNQAGSPNYLHWIIDAYTISDRYPYSDPGDNKFNYIRNSVKIVVDAYNGDIDFYIAEPEDPIIQTWNHIFPELFQPLNAMPKNLRPHIRYPRDLFSIQSKQLRTYQMTDPQIFYNREDQWQSAQEIYGTELQKVEPYYLIIKLPTAANEEFILINLYTPTRRNNLIATLFGRSDENEYGKLLLYRYPKQRQIYGPEQIDARINQDPVISERISLWNRQGSRVIQGNLLVIPIADSLLYVEPLYLEAERNSLPTLARVIVVYENRIVMAETLQQALQKAVLEPKDSSPPAVTGVINETNPSSP
ncbi:MAG: UPF0182 family protein [Prochloraceae cyanobacterium]|nr:UPF0182 family protein [Prochloraceae cyanobacterium]